MGIYVYFESHMICLHNDYKALNKVYTTLQTSYDLVKNWLRYSPIFVEATFITVVVMQ